MKFDRRIASPLTALGLVLALATVGFGAYPAAGHPLVSTTDANITRLTTSVLEHSQFAHHPFDGELAETFLNRYLDSLDPARSLFLASDFREFAAGHATLAKATHDGDTHAAQVIFNRYLERLRQREAYMKEALRGAPFDFTGHEFYSFDREHAPRPPDLAAARDLWQQQLRAEYLDEKLGDKPRPEIAKRLNRRFEQQLRAMEALRSDEVLELYLNALAHVYDPHSDYLGHEQMESLSIAMKLSLLGIGASLETADGYCTVREVIPGGPAARSGALKPGDRIVAVSQPGQQPVDITDMPLSRAVELIRGPKGTTVTLSVIPAGAPDGSPSKKESLVRDAIRLDDQEARATIVDLPNGPGSAPLRLGVIDLPSFYADLEGRGSARGRSATVDVARLLRKLNAEGVHGVVLDLRRNGGGSLDEAISLTGLFIRKGPVVQTRDQAGNVEVGADDDPAVAYDGPLVVLTSRFSASASEILAGALQDYGRALVVGDSSTFGKGTVQNVMPLAPVMDRFHLAHAYDPGALKVTISKFYRPSGASTQLRGVAADVVLPSTSDVPSVSESALNNPLPWDTIPSATYDRLNRVQPYVSMLRARSAQRTGAEKAFHAVAAEIARLREAFATKSVSLNEAERRQGLGQAKAEREERLAAERADAAASPPTYAITLANAALPGLPPPLSNTDDAKTVKSTAVASTPDVLDEEPTGPSAPDDIVLSESERILADYVSLVDHAGAAAPL